jgi:adenine phosphoribosyltransferase
MTAPMTATTSTMGLASTGYPARLVRRLGVPDGVRDVRVVHQVDGINDAVHPADLLSVGHQLWNRWRRHPRHRDHEVVLGLDAGGILPTIAVALASATPYRLAWKLNLDLPDRRVFTEPHARRAEVFVYGDLRGQRILVVDDEITAGATAGNLIAVLAAAGADVVGVVCLVEETSGGGRAELDRRGVPLCALTSL